MKSIMVFAGMLCALIACVTEAAAPPQVHRRTLPNGMRLAYIHVKDSTNFSTFSFLPMGLAHDDADHTQWAHLIEHLTLRATIPGQLTEANAETQGDHMRLDFYGTRENWKTGLDHHAKWLGGVAFTDVSVRQEPARANSEADNVAKNLVAHKFALAAWNQAVRHGKSSVAVKGDLLNADKAALQAYRDAHLVIANQTLIVMVGGIEPREVLTAAAESFGAIKPSAKPSEAAQTKPGNVEATWDVRATHTLLTWPVPSIEADPTNHAAILLLARLLWMQIAQDSELSNTFGPAILEHALRCPESNYFCVSATVKPDAKEANPEKLLAERIKATLSEWKSLPPMMVKQLAQQLIAEMDVPDPAIVAQQIPNADPKLIEAQIAITWGTSEHRLAARRDAIVTALRSMTVEKLKLAAGRYLTPERMTSLRLVPPPQS